MPTTLVGFALFVVLLAPGLAYVARARISQPIAKPSPLREAARLSLISLACDAGAVGMFGVLRVWLPDHTPNIGELVRHPGPYAVGHYAYLAIWGVGLLSLAVAIALTGAMGLDSAPGRRLLSSTLLRRITVRGGEVTDQPAWWTWLNTRYRTYIQCELDDGTLISGYLASFSAESDETSDRDLVLADEVTIRAAGEVELRALDASGLIISARSIRWLSFTYLDAPTVDSPSARSAVSAPAIGLICGALGATTASAIWYLSQHR